MSLHFATIYLINFAKKITAWFRPFIDNPIIKNFIIVSSGSFFLKGASIAVIPLTLKMLTPSQYGLLALFTSFNNIFIAISGLGLRQVFFLEYFHSNEFERKKITNTIIGIYLFFSIPILATTLIMLPSINRVCFSNAATSSLIVLSLIYSFSYFFSELFYQHLQYACKALELTVLQVSIAFTTIGLTIYMVHGLGLGLTGMLLANAVGGIMAVIIAGYYYIKTDHFNSFNMQHLKYHIKPYLLQGTPFVPGILFAWILSSGDKWVLAYYGTLADVGVYAIADAFSQLFYVLILYPLSGSYLPWLLKEFSHNQTLIATIEQKNKKIMYGAMIAVASLIFLSLSLGKSLFCWLLPAKFHESFGYIWPILLGNVFLMGSYFASALIQYHKKSYFLGLAIGLPAIFNIGLNFILIPLLGIYGCSLSTLFAYMAYFGLILGYNTLLLKR